MNRHLLGRQAPHLIGMQVTMVMQEHHLLLLFSILEIGREGSTHCGEQLARTEELEPLMLPLMRPVGLPMVCMLWTNFHRSLQA